MEDGKSSNGITSKFVQLNVMVQGQEVSQPGGPEPGHGSSHHQHNHHHRIEVEALTTPTSNGYCRPCRASTHKAPCEILTLVCDVHV